MLIRFNKAQSTLEYALLITVVVGALLGMQNYLKRSLMGRMQASANQIGEQYSPGLTFIDRETVTHTDQIVEVKVSGTSDGTKIKPGGPATTMTEVKGASQERTETKDIKPLEDELWH